MTFLSGTLAILSSTSSQWNASSQQQLVDLVQAMTQNIQSMSCIICNIAFFCFDFTLVQLTHSHRLCNRFLLVFPTCLVTHQVLLLSPPPSCSVYPADNPSGSRSSSLPNVRPVVTQLAQVAINGMICGQDNTLLNSASIAILAGKSMSTLLLQKFSTLSNPPPLLWFASI